MIPSQCRTCHLYFQLQLYIDVIVFLFLGNMLEKSTSILCKHPHFSSIKQSCNKNLFYSLRPIFKKSQYFRRGLKVVPPKKFPIFMVPKLSQYNILRKSQKKSGYTYYQYLKEFKNSTRGGGIKPPPHPRGH